MANTGTLSNNHIVKQAFGLLSYSYYEPLHDKTNYMYLQMTCPLREEFRCRLKPGKCLVWFSLHCVLLSMLDTNTSDRADTQTALSISRVLTVKFPNFVTLENFAVIILKLEKKRFYHQVMHPKDADVICK